uniref:Carbohydrate kinase FGGY C-terminal domain-containing protein n=1 Tax=Timema poppense TaxID=170557 RepID=A0A7R9D645_TIMPO|nr:unnamed protein product [Timema poppensis]
MDITQSRKSLILWPYASGLTGRKRGASFTMTPLALPITEHRYGSQLSFASRITPKPPDLLRPLDRGTLHSNSAGGSDFLTEEPDRRAKLASNVTAKVPARSEVADAKQPATRSSGIRSCLWCIHFRVDGGVSHNDFVCQLLADLIEIKVERPTSTEMSVLGVGFLAGLYSGVWKSKEELCQLRKVDRVFEPQKNSKQNYEPIMTQWSEALTLYIGALTLMQASGIMSDEVNKTSHYIVDKTYTCSQRRGEAGWKQRTKGKEKTSALEA